MKREPVSGAHLREAERALIGMLRNKGFPVAWVNHNAVDLLAQANLEYIEWLKRHEPEANPVGWLVTCAYRRGLNLLTSQGRRGGASSIEDAVDLADESSPSPEQAALDDDRQRRLRGALSHLPARERRLLSLVYFEDCSIREAGRRLGWRKSAADRHHQAALERLRALVDPSLLSPAGLGLASWVVDRSEGSRLWGATARVPVDLVSERASAAGEAMRSGGRRLGELARRLVPFGDSVTLATSGGAGRVLGACGAAAIAAGCALLVGEVASEKAPHRDAAPPAPSVRTTAPLAEPTPAPRTRTSASAPVHTAPSQQRAAHVERSSIPEGARATAERRGETRGAAATPAPATPQQVEEEFGIEHEAAPTPEAAPPPTSTAARPEAVSPSHNTTPNAPPASGAQVESEFGL